MSPDQFPAAFLADVTTNKIDSPAVRFVVERASSPDAVPPGDIGLSDDEAAQLNADEQAIKLRLRRELAVKVAEREAARELVRWINARYRLGLVENDMRWGVLMALYFIACDTSRTPGDRFEFIARRLVDWDIVR